MDLTVKWGKERIIITFPDPSTTLGQLKATLEERTSVPQTQFKLVHGGAVLKDNNAPLSAYKLKPGSSLTLIGSASSLPSKKDSPSNVPTGPDLRTESGMNAAIQAELANVERTITPSLTSLLSTLGFAPQTSNPLSTPSTSQLSTSNTPATITTTTATATTITNPPSSQPTSTQTATETPAETLRQSHARLGELLLQSLLRLDALTPPSEWEETRRARKAAVKHVQGNLDALDTAWKGFVAKGGLEEGGVGTDKEGGRGEGTGSVKGKGKGKRRK